MYDDPVALASVFFENDDEEEMDGSDAWEVSTSSQSFDRADENERDVIGVYLKCERGSAREDDFFASEPDYSVITSTVS